MNGFFGLPPGKAGDVKIYLPTTGVNGQGYQVWQKPKGASLVFMLLLSGGGGGGGGFTRTAGSAGGGGGGGACSNLTRFLVPADLLPNEMYIQVGHGGLGAAAGGTGGSGVNSFVLSSKTAVLPNIIAYSGVGAPGGGGGGTGAAAGGAGAVPSVPVIQPWNILGQWNTTIGLVGAAGGAQTGAVGASITCWASIPLSPGAGGAGCTTTDFAGGAQTATALLDLGNLGYYPTGAGNVAKGGTAAGVGVDGSSGASRISPLFCSGGAGGGSNNSGQAGNGGKGGIGCGGGGGGAGATGGRGGDGGPGLVLIASI